jgi:hypothetical protein
LFDNDGENMYRKAINQPPTGRKRREEREEYEYTGNCRPRTETVKDEKRTCI